MQDIVVAGRTSVIRDGRIERLHNVPVLTLDDWRAAKAMSPAVSGAVLSYMGDALIGAIGRWRSAQLTRRTPNLADFSGLDVSIGRFFSDADVARHADVVVLGHRLAEELAVPRDPLWLVGQSVRVAARRLEVVGVLARRDGGLDRAALWPQPRRT